VKLLLDTHLLLWALNTPSRLPARARRLVADEAHEPCFSAVSIWEVAIKAMLERSDFAADAAQVRRALLDNGWTEVAVTGVHAAATRLLPLLHRDPFDRLLVAQATTEGVTLLTADPVVARYPGPIHKV
jgi:PIN domain nuclease of toxin-antitoxin system